MNLDDVLNIRASEIDRPPLIPVGTYQFSVVSFDQKDVNSGNGNWKVIEFQIAGVAAMQVPDAEGLAKFGLQNVKSRISFMFDQDDATKAEVAKFQLKTFLTKHLGQSEDATMRELLATSIGKVFLGVVSHRADKNDPQIMYAEVRKTAPL